jgi:hypothetical protein
MVKLKNGREVGVEQLVQIPHREGVLEVHKVLPTMEGRMLGVDHVETTEILEKFGASMPHYSVAIAALARSDHRGIAGKVGYVKGPLDVKEEGLWTWNEKGELVRPKENENPRNLVHVTLGREELSLTILNPTADPWWGYPWGYELYAGPRLFKGYPLIFGIRSSGATGTEGLKQTERLLRGGTEPRKI